MGGRKVMWGGEERRGGGSGATISDADGGRTGDSDACQTFLPKRYRRWRPQTSWKHQEEEQKNEADPPRGMPRGQPHTAGRTVGASRSKGQACEGSGRPAAPPPLIRPPVAHRAPWTASPTVAGVAGGLPPRPPLNRVAPALEFAVGRRLARATCGGRLTPGGRASGPRVRAIIFANRFSLTVRWGERARGGGAPFSAPRAATRRGTLVFVGSASTRTGTSGGRGRMIHPSWAMIARRVGDHGGAIMA